MVKHENKKILITGANSYIGTSFEKWIARYNLSRRYSQYHIDTVETKNYEWKETSFAGYDTVFHVAGIVHINETKENKTLFFSVNRDLTVELAQKAKKDGVKQFIFLSTMNVYGINSGVITQKTSPSPRTSYGISKLQAEEKIQLLKDDNFNIAIIRPPMVYGKNCKGNYSRLAALSLMLPLFPEVDNQRSMIYIDNLSEFVRVLIDDCSSGVFLPQNEEYVNTSKLVMLIASANGKKIRKTKLFNPILRLLCKKIDIINKVFGDLVYDQNVSRYKKNYCVSGLEESVRLTEA